MCGHILTKKRGGGGLRCGHKPKGGGVSGTGLVKTEGLRN